MLSEGAMDMQALGWMGELFVPKDLRPMLIPNCLKKSRERYLPIFEQVQVLYSASPSPGSDVACLFAKRILNRTRQVK